MTDIVDPAKRSKMMASIRGKDTKPEIRIRSGLHRLGLRFRLHCRELPGSPDLVFPRYRTVLFVHGCFWHRHDSCKLAYTPSTNSHKWTEKFKANVERDQRQLSLLQQAGWRVFIVWECAARNNDISGLLVAVATELKSGESTCREWPANAIQSNGKNLMKFE